METQICIIGAGPAGLTAAIFAAQAGVKAVVIEKNATAGRKLLLTGGGRCNLTHTGSIDEFVRIYGKAGRFLRHSLYEFSPAAAIEFFSGLGIETKVYEDGCVFPASERADDVRDAILQRSEELGVQFFFSRGVERVEKRGDKFAVFTGLEILTVQKLVIATGGVSFSQTGSTGDGYKMAKILGHTIIEPRPALVPFVTDEKWCADLAGTSLDSVTISAMVDKKKLKVCGPLVFTHDGIGGPAVLDLSRLLADYLPASVSLGEAGPAEKPIEVFIDIVPAMNETKLDEYLTGQLSQYSRKIIVNVLFDLIPKKIAGLLCRQAGVAETTGNQLKKEERRKIVQLLKRMTVSVKATRPIEEATVTRGGVSKNEIDPRTMESRICPGLYFAGEVIDADGPCGGYNLQIAWSTGALAGKSAAK